MRVRDISTKLRAIRKWLVTYEARTTYLFVGSPQIIDAYTVLLVCGARWEAFRLRRRIL